MHILQAASYLLCLVELQSLWIFYFKLLQVVEIARGSKVKYELDKTSGLIKVRFIVLASVLI